MVKESKWREIMIPPLEEGRRVLLKPDFEQRLKRPLRKMTKLKGVHRFYPSKPDNSSWNLIKEFFEGRLEQLLYRRIDCNRGNLDYCYAVKAIKGDDSDMGHLVSMVFGASVASMSEPDERIWLHDVPTMRKFPYEVVRTKSNGWRLQDNCNKNVKLLYNAHYLMMIVRTRYFTDIYFCKIPYVNV